jgi:hypothetical protein
MPDLITHTAVAHLIRRPFESVNPSDDPAQMRILFLVGVMLPDLMSRPWYILSPAVQIASPSTLAGMLIAWLRPALRAQPEKKGIPVLYRSRPSFRGRRLANRSQATISGFFRFPEKLRNRIVLGREVSVRARMDSPGLCMELYLFE